MAEYVDIDYPFTAYTDRGQTIETSIRKIMQTNPFLDIPIADVVERKHGKWTDISVYGIEDTSITDVQSAICSVCHKYHTTPYMYYFDNFNFCPNCGADMSNTVALT